MHTSCFDLDQQHVTQAESDCVSFKICTSKPRQLLLENAKLRIRKYKLKFVSFYAFFHDIYNSA